jgi:hypothetical protein
MRLFDTPGADSAYDKWLTTTPADRGHAPECNCDRCHQAHIDESMVEENAESHDYKCCIEQLEDWVGRGKRCGNHPKSYFEPAEKGKLAYCEECDLLSGKPKGEPDGTSSPSGKKS